MTVKRLSKTRVSSAMVASMSHSKGCPVPNSIIPGFDIYPNSVSVLLNSSNPTKKIDCRRGHSKICAQTTILSHDHDDSRRPERLPPIDRKEEK